MTPARAAGVPWANAAVTVPAVKSALASCLRTFVLFEQMSLASSAGQMAIVLEYPTASSIVITLSAQ